MNTRRRFIVVLGASLLASGELFAQQPSPRIAKLGILISESQSSPLEQARVEAFRKGLRELGYEEGKNIVLDIRWADANYDRLPAMATDLVKRKVDVLVTFGIKAATAAMKVTTTVPIVLPATYADVVALGFAQSLAHPGRNFTGSTSFGPEMMAKRLELIKEILPRASHVAVLVNPANPSFEASASAMEPTARHQGLKISRRELKHSSELAPTIAGLAKARVDAIVLQGDTLFTANSRMIAELAAKHHTATFGGPDLAEAGGLIGYGPNTPELYRRAAGYVDRILKGTKPGDLPIEQPTKFDLKVNMKTARVLNIKVPNSVLVRADKVIE